VHEESSDISKRIMAEAQARGYPLFVDTTGDSAPGKFQGKLRAALDAGYDVEVRYTDLPVGEAKRRSDARAAKTGRWLAHDMIEKTHHDVASRLADYENMPGVKVGIYSNDVSQGQSPVLIAHKESGDAKLTVQDVARMKQLRDKASGG
jgi:predicted ABC-type ATPase